MSKEKKKKQPQLFHRSRFKVCNTRATVTPEYFKIKSYTSGKVINDGGWLASVRVSELTRLKRAK